MRGMAPAAPKDRRDPLPLRGAARVAAVGAGYFAAVFAAGFVLGVARTLVLEPWLGRLLAVAIELPLMLAWAWWVCSRLLQRRPPATLPTAAAVGTVAFALLMLAEAALSTLLAGRSPAEHLALYREPAHALGLLGQLAFAAWPLLWAWRRARATGTDRRLPAFGRPRGGPDDR
jgi:hypothetical protein